MYLVKNLRSFFLFTIIFFAFAGCQYFSSTQVSADEIKTASTWSTSDQAPTYPTCESLDTDAKKNCFESLVSSSIMDYVSANIGIASAEISEEILLTIQINKEGFFSLISASLSNELQNAMPQLQNVLETAVQQLPQAQPALKTNVGIFVTSNFQLPLTIKATQG